MLLSVFVLHETKRIFNIHNIIKIDFYKETNKFYIIFIKMTEKRIYNLKFLPFTKKEEMFLDLYKELINKWNEDYNKGIISLGIIKNWSLKQKDEFVKKERRFVLINNNIICEEKCLICTQYKPITPIYFFYKNLNKKYESGKELIHNNSKIGCKECYKNISKIRFLEVSEKEYIRRILTSYTNLNESWYKTIPNICAISNITLHEKNKSEWRVSIQNNDTNTNHLPKNCCKIAFEFNVAEHNIVKKNLITTYKEEIFPSFLNELINPSDTTELINFIIIWYNNSSKENGVITRNDNSNKSRNIYIQSLYKLHLKSLLARQCNTYKLCDKRRKKTKEQIVQANINTEMLFNKLLKQKMKCYYTNIPFSTDRDTWNFWSLERIDNSKNHTDENTVFVCRIFNTTGGLNRKKLLYALLTQIHVPLSNDVKMNIKKELEIL